MALFTILKSPTENIKKPTFDTTSIFLNNLKDTSIFDPKDLIEMWGVGRAQIPNNPSLSQENTQENTQENNQQPTNVGITSVDSNIKGLSFLQMVNKYGEGKIRLTSSYRPGGRTKQGRPSNHSKKHETFSKLDGKNVAYAYDIVPAKGYNFDDLRNLFVTPVWRAWLASQDNPNHPGKGWGFIDETIPEAMAKTGATGPHFHVGPDSWALKDYTTLLSKYNLPQITFNSIDQLNQPLENAESLEILIDKSKRTLTIRNRVFNINYSKKGIAPKKVSDDGLTPEGTFNIIGYTKQGGYNDSVYGYRPTAYGKSGHFFRLSYKDDKGLQTIGIHGSDQYNDPSNLKGGTHGCISMSDNDIEEFKHILELNGGYKNFKVKIVAAKNGLKIETLKKLKQNGIV